MSYFTSLSDEAKKLLIDQDYGETIGLFEFIDEFYKSYYIKSMPIVNSYYEIEIGTHSLNFLQSNIYRSMLLSKSFVDGLEAKNPLQCSLAIRAQIETCGAITFFYKKYNQYLGNIIDEKQIKETLHSLLNGVRAKDFMPNFIDIPEPVSVMKLIDTIEHFQKNNLKKKGKLIREAYDHLSEVCHPNSFGYLLSLSNSRPGFRDPSDPYEGFTYNVNFYLLCMTIYSKAYQETFSIILKNEKIPAEYKLGNELF